MIQIDLFLDRPILLNLLFAKCASCCTNCKIWVSLNVPLGLLSQSTQFLHFSVWQSQALPSYLKTIYNIQYGQLFFSWSKARQLGACWNAGFFFEAADSFGMDAITQGKNWNRWVWIATNTQVKAEAKQNFTNTDYAFKLFNQAHPDERMIPRKNPRFQISLNQVNSRNKPEGVHLIQVWLHKV